MPDSPTLEDIGARIRFDDRMNFFGGHAIEHAAHQALGVARWCVEGIAARMHFEPEQVGRFIMRAFEGNARARLERVQRVCSEPRRGRLERMMSFERRMSRSGYKSTRAGRAYQARLPAAIRTVASAGGPHRRAPARSADALLHEMGVS